MPVVDRVSLRVDAGEIVALLGVNGAGKTTLLETAVGLRSPDGGAVRITGLNPQRQPHRVGSVCGVALQDGGVWQATTPREALTLHAQLYDDPWEVEELLAELGLTDAAGTRVRQLSGGQRRRLGVALALVGRPSVLVLDEPTSSLDLPARERLWAVLRRWRAAGAAVLLSTHLREEAEQLADRVALLHQGRLAACDRPAALAAQAGPRLEVRYSGEVDASPLGGDLGLPVEVLEGGWLRIAAGGEAIPSVTAWLDRHGAVVESVRTSGLAEVMSELDAASVREQGR